MRCVNSYNKVILTPRQNLKWRPLQTSFRAETSILTPRIIHEMVLQVSLWQSPLIIPIIPNISHLCQGLYLPSRQMAPQLSLSTGIQIRRLPNRSRGSVRDSRFETNQSRISLIKVLLRWTMLCHISIRMFVTICLTT